MNIDQRIIEGALRSAWAECKTQSPPSLLRLKLESRMASQFEAVAGGSVKSISGNGHSMTFKTAGEGGATPEDMVGLWGFLVEKYDQAVADLGSSYSFTTDNAGDFTIEIGNAIVEQIVGYLRPISGYVNNFMYMSK